MIKASNETEEGGGGSVTVVEMSGNETDEQCKDIAWQTMCNAHPVEAHAYDPERFWKYFHARAPHVTREQMVATLKECEDPEDESPNTELSEPGEAGTDERKTR
jgi:hypothetical protein